MRGSHILISLVGLVIGFLMLSAGSFLFLTASLPQASQAARFVLQHHLEGLSYCGLVIFFLGLLFLSLLFYLNRRRYLLLIMGNVSVDEKVVAQCVHQSLEFFFPGQPVESDLILTRSGRIKIFANIPTLSEENREHTLQEIEAALNRLLIKQFFYNRPFLFNVSFFDPV